MEKQESKIERLEQKLADIEERVVPRVCQTCNLFTFNKVKKKNVPRNRYCQYEGEIKLEKGRCIYWKQADDLWKRQPRNITV